MTVVALEGDEAILAACREEACYHCPSAETCGKQVEIRLANTLSASVGDQVEVETRTASFLSTCALVFLVPILAALAVLFVTYERERTLLSALFSLVTFFLSLVLAVVFLRRKKAAWITMKRIASRK